VPALELSLRTAAPEPPTAGALLIGGHLSWLAVALVVAAGAYLYGVLRLRQRGDRWPPVRTAMFLGPGLGAIAAVTLTGVETYDTTLLSVHMIQHMVLGMIAPIFLALGAPVTLALRTLPTRPRRWLLAAVHSRVARVLAFPLVAYGFFVATPFALYFSGLYEATMRSALLHEVAHLHFIVVGCLFFWPLVGLDPLPGRWPYPARALMMFQSRTLVGGDWYPSLGLSWADPFADQRVAGGLLWAGGELVSVTMLGVLVVQWMRHADREAKRVDRQLDREEALDRQEAAAQAASPTGPAASTGTIPAAPVPRQGASA
jgi:putative membrane protein